MAGQKQKALIFDLDGTLADTLPLYLDIIYKGRTSSQSSVSLVQLARLRQYSLLRLIGKLDVPPLSRTRLLWHRWKKLHRRIGDTQSFGDLLDVIQTLHTRGHRLFVLTSNYERNARAFLRAKNIDQYFEGVYHANVFRKASGLKSLMRREHIRNRQAYYIANEPIDMEAAERAEVHGVGVLWSGQLRANLTKEHPAHIVNNPAELLRLFN